MPASAIETSGELVHAVLDIDRILNRLLSYPDPSYGTSGKTNGSFYGFPSDIANTDVNTQRRLFRFVKPRTRLSPASCTGRVSPGPR